MQMRNTLSGESFAAANKAMMAEIANAPEVVRPSSYWQELNRRHTDRLAASGIQNFKRTLAKDYFTWMRVLPWDSQIRFLVTQLPVSATLRSAAGAFAPLKHDHIPFAEGMALNFLTRLLWEYASRQ